MLILLAFRDCSLSINTTKSFTTNDVLKTTTNNVYNKIFNNDKLFKNSMIFIQHDVNPDAMAVSVLSA